TSVPLSKSSQSSKPSSANPNSEPPRAPGKPSALCSALSPPPSAPPLSETPIKLWLRDPKTAGTLPGRRIIVTLAVLNCAVVFQREMRRQELIMHSAVSDAQEDLDAVENEDTDDKLSAEENDMVATVATVG